MLNCTRINGKRPNKVRVTNVVVVVGVAWLLMIMLVSIVPVVQACDVMGATYCIHKPEKDLKEENLEEYCDKYKEHLECTYSKYKGCDKKEKYETAMESMIRGLRKKAKQVIYYIWDLFERTLIEIEYSNKTCHFSKIQ